MKLWRLKSPTHDENERGECDRKRRKNGKDRGRGERRKRDKHLRTNVKSCRITLAGLKGISTLVFMAGDQLRMFCTSFSRTWKLSQLRTADSSSTRTEKGSFSVSNTIEQCLLHQYFCQLQMWASLCPVL